MTVAWPSAPRSRRRSCSRVNDGRWTPVTYAPGTQPGEFRGVNPVNQTGQFIRPFAIVSNDQFRATARRLCDSPTYAEDLQRSQVDGRHDSTKRTPAQFAERALPHRVAGDLEHAQLPDLRCRQPVDRRERTLDGDDLDGANDAGNACFESKYHFYFWRPQSAIPLAGTDGNAATEADADLDCRSVPTPNHPEYPAAHACVNGAGAEVLEAFYGTKKITYTFSSTVTNTRRPTTRPTRCSRRSRTPASMAACTSGLRRARPRARHEGRQVDREAPLHAGGLITGRHACPRLLREPQGSRNSDSFERGSRLSARSCCAPLRRRRH